MTIRPAVITFVITNISKCILYAKIPVVVRINNLYWFHFLPIIINRLYNGNGNYSGIVPPGYGPWPLTQAELKTKYQKVNLVKAKALMAAAAQFQGAGQSDGVPGPDGAPPDQTPTLSQPGKINDMSMPGAGGGANNQPLQ